LTTVLPAARPGESTRPSRTPPALDNTRTNNVNQHFITAFLGLHLKGEDYASYLDVVESSDASNDYNDPGYPDGIWKGFKMWSAVGMEMKRLQP
jgi:hypothetical protein